MDWFLYDNGLRHERVNYVSDTNLLDDDASLTKLYSIIVVDLL